MSSVEVLREAVLRRASEEAERIIANAKEGARKILEEAKEKKKAVEDSEKRRIVSELNYEARIAEARMKARLLVSKAKYELISRAVSRVARLLEDLGPEARALSVRNLLAEAIREAENSLGTLGKLIVYVSERDFELAKEAIKELVSIRGLEMELRTAGISGGVIVEDPEGRVRIDNSYESRISVLLSRLSRDIVREVIP